MYPTYGPADYKNFDADQIRAGKALGINFDEGIEIIADFKVHGYYHGNYEAELVFVEAFQGDNGFNISTGNLNDRRVELFLDFVGGEEALWHIFMSSPDFDYYYG